MKIQGGCSKHGLIYCLQCHGKQAKAGNLTNSPVESNLTEKDVSNLTGNLTHNTGNLTKQARWRAKNPDRYRVYMREYMRARRKQTCEISEH
jgi:hypothetical protein